MSKTRDSASLRARTEVKLSKMSLKHHQALTKYILHIKTAIEKSVKAALAGIYSEEEIDAMEVEWVLPVPQMWEEPTNQRMQDAAERAGMKNVELVPEPQCAAANYAGNLKYLPPGFDDDDAMLVLDVGGGTGDVCTVVFSGDRTAGFKLLMSVAGQPEEYLKDQTNQRYGYDGFQKMCDLLHINVAAAEKQAMDQFERIKQDFEVVEDDSKYIHIHGPRRRGRGRNESCEFELRSTTIASFFDRILKKIFAAVNSQIKQVPRIKACLQYQDAMIIPGGFGKSPYLLTTIAEHYPHITITGQDSELVGSSQGIAHGALCRFTDFMPRRLTTSGHIGIAQAEVWDPELEEHHDATIWTGTSKLKAKANESIAYQDLFNRQRFWNVPARWIRLMPKGTHYIPGQQVKSETWQQQYLEPDETEIRLPMLWTKTDIQDHMPVLATGSDINDEDPKFVEGIELLCERRFKMPDLKALKFKLHKGNNSKQYYEIWYRIIMECHETRTSVSIELALPGTALYNGNSILKGPTNADAVLLTV
ncbi:hypothetical protein LTR27_001561 [Elasticomyces elasticus]|nr:hypothetical protein LTR27_001561 [Elasticomyces elasticus]